jgi:hypothetical protein
MIELEKITPKASEEPLCRYKNLSGLLSAIVDHLRLKSDFFDRSIIAIRSITSPNSGERKNLWVNPSLPPSLGVFASGRWRKIYPYPVGVATPWVLSSNPPSYLTKLSNSQLTTLGLSKDVTWVVFNPENESIST